MLNIEIVSSNDYLLEALESAQLNFAKLSKEHANIKITNQDNCYLLEYDGEKVFFKKPIKISEIIRYLTTVYNNFFIVIAELKLFPAKLILEHSNGASVSLSDNEMKILLHLYDKSSTPVSLEDISKKVFAYHEGVESKALESTIYRLRQKIITAFDFQIIFSGNKGYFLA